MPVLRILFKQIPGHEKKAGEDDVVLALMETVLTSVAFRKNWDRLIQKIYHVNPLLCPKCKGAMKIVAFIEETAVIRKILVHLDLWDVRNHDPPAKTHGHIPELTQL